MAFQPSANPTYKLTYFDLKALAEPIRFLFAYGNIKYEDVRIATEKWPEIKPTMPLGQMPVLDIDGQRVHQSVAIGRYFAKKVGLAGADDWEQLLVDIAVDTINDLRASELLSSAKTLIFEFVAQLLSKNSSFHSEMSAAFWDEDEAVKTKKLEGLKKDVIPFYLDKLDAIVQENNGYFVLGKVYPWFSWQLLVIPTVNFHHQFSFAVNVR